MVHDYLPNAELVMLNSVREYFEGRYRELDAMVLTAQRGSAWTLIYPGFTAASPQPDALSVPLARWPIQWRTAVWNWSSLSTPGSS